MSGGTGQIVGAIAGAALADFTGGLSYVALGASLGSMVGSLFNKGVNTQGPRLDDLKVQVSTYGTPIPTVYGTARVGGNVIWSTDKLEIGTTQTAGKGGSASNTSYKYYIHMAIALCYGPITGIRKIWQDGRLIYDMSSGISVGSALATINNPYAGLQLFYGDEAQLPDPIIEGYEGVGNVPAYRGIAYVRLIDVECPGGRVPQFSFEVSAAAVPGPDHLLLVSGHTVYGAWVGSEYTLGLEHVAVPLSVNVYRNMQGAWSLWRNIPLPNNNITYFTRPAIGSDAMGLRPSTDNVGNYYVHLVDLNAGAVSLLYSGPLGGLTIDFKGGAAFDPVSGFYAMVPSSSVSTPTPLIFDGGAPLVCAALSGTCSAIAFYSSHLYALSSAASNNLNFNVYNADGTLGATIAAPAYPGGTAGWDYQASAIQVNASGTYVYLQTLSVAQGYIYRLDGASTWTLLCSSVIPSAVFAAPSVNQMFWTSNDSAMVGPVGTGGVLTDYYLTRFASLAVSPVTVASIITDQCTKAGLTSGQFDVSTLQDTVWGYIIANVASARDNLQPLLTAYAIDAVDEDGKVKFFKRAAITSMATVTYNELGCVDGNGQPGDPLPLARTQEIDLPSSVSVSYINPNYDYQTVTETARRITDLSRNDQQVNLAICAGADFMASVAQMLLYDAWNERNRRTAQVSRKWAYLSAGDGATIEYPAGTLLLWRLSKVTDTGTLMQWELVPADATIYTQQAIGSAPKPSLQVPALPAPTNAQIIDGPILQDADNNGGLYVAMSGYAAPFPGAELLVGNDAPSLTSRGTVTNEAPTGTATTVPTAWPSTSIDETNLITVNMGRFTLNSCTRDVLLAGATNFAAYGINGRWEYIAFRTVSSLGGGLYTLSGLLRGQRGTEWASGLHQAGDSFIMLGLAGTLRVTLDAGSVGTQKLYRAITLGRTTGNDQTYSSTAEGLKCFSPVNVRKSVDASNNITLTINRRTRLSQNWLMGIVPLGETSEHYSWDLFTSSGFTTIAGTFVTNYPTLALTSAQQAAIGLTPGATVYVNVYQLSDSIGRGHPAQATV